MKITALQNQAHLLASQNNAVSGVSAVKSNTFNNSVNQVSAPHSVITFGGIKNKGHVLHVLAELPPWMKVGGVATVGKDYMNTADWFDQLKAQYPDIAAALGDGKSKVSLVIPYYNGELGDNNSVSVRTIAGQPIWINEADAKKYAYDKAALAADKKAVTKLQEVVSTDMQWGATKSTPVKMFKVVDHPALQGKDNIDVYMLYTDGTARMPKAYANGDYCSEPPEKVKLEKALSADQLRGMAPDGRAKALTDAYTSKQPYHMFSKGVVEAVEKAGIDAETIICSDSQTMLVPEFIAQKSQAGDKFFEGAKTTGVFHNTGAVYCGECSPKEIFLAMASPEQIEMVRKSPEYNFALQIGREEDYFKRFVKGYQDANNNTNPNMVMLQHVKNGYGYVNTVSQEYAKSMAENPDVTPLQPLWKELYDQGKVGGIINGFEDESVSAFKKLGLGGYTTQHVVRDVHMPNYPVENDILIRPYVTYALDDMKKAIGSTVEPLQFKEGATVDEMITSVSDMLRSSDKIDVKSITFHIQDSADPTKVEDVVINKNNQLELLPDVFKRKITSIDVERGPILEVTEAEKALINSATESNLQTAKIAKRHNKISFLERFAYDPDNKYAIAGLPGRDLSLMGSINPGIVQRIKAGEDVPLFVSWGRGDFQKGHPIALESFIKFAKTKEGSNAVLVLGGELPKGTAEAMRIQELMSLVESDAALKGRVVFINGFAPGYAMSSAADFALFTSRFEPCGLTDLEAQKYFATPITMNTQGFAQKVFDPRTAPEGSIVNGYKSTNEFFMPKEKIDNVVELFATKTKKLDDAAKSKLMADFPYSSDNFSRFEEFGKEYNVILEKVKKDFRGKVSQGEIDKRAIAEMPMNPEYQALLQTLKEDILSDELSAAMKQAVADAADPEMAEKIFKSQLELNTTWMGNGALNGVDPKTGKELSSAELYCRRHVMPDAPATAPKMIFQFDEDIVNTRMIDAGDFYIPGGEVKEAVASAGDIKGATAVDSKALESLSQNVKQIGDKLDGITDAIKNAPANNARQASSYAPGFGKKGFLTSITSTITDKKALAAIGALAAVGAAAALIYTKAKDDKNKTNSVPETQSMNTTQTTYQPQIPVIAPDNRFSQHFQKMA